MELTVFLATVIGFIGSYSIIGSMYHNFMVRRRLIEIRDAIREMKNG
jgi:hypothetical protein